MVTHEEQLVALRARLNKLPGPRCVFPATPESLVAKPVRNIDRSRYLALEEREHRMGLDRRQTGSWPFTSASPVIHSKTAELEFSARLG